MSARRKLTIHLGTKEENNARRDAEFLALSPWARFLLFMRDVALNADPQESPGERKGNFMVQQRRNGVRGGGQ